MNSFSTGPGWSSLFFLVEEENGAIVVGCVAELGMGGCRI